MNEVDVVVIGAGIHGAGVAQAAAAAGYSVLILEKMTLHRVPRANQASSYMVAYVILKVFIFHLSVNHLKNVLFYAA